MRKREMENKEGRRRIVRKRGTERKREKIKGKAEEEGENETGTKSE